MNISEERKRYIIHMAKTRIIVLKNGCHVWKGSKNQAGYGLIEYKDTVTGRRICTPIHRAYFTFAKNLSLTRSDFVCHKCDNPSCVNIDHLWLGNAQKNSDDKYSKDRGNIGKKNVYHHRNKKYSDEQIEKAKDMLKSGMRMIDVKKATGFSHGQVYGLNWGLLKRADGEQYPLSIPLSAKGIQTAMSQGRIERSTL